MPKIKTIESDHFPEVVKGGKGTRRTELLGVKEYLRTPHDRREIFANLSNERFQNMLGHINSITRGQPIKYDYGSGEMKMLSTPPAEDKAQLMDLTFQSVRNIAANVELNDHDALQRAALTMAGAVNLTHPYEDGNGRTARVAHYVVEYGTERGDEAFNDELYAIIGKLPVYDTDERVALYDTIPPELVRGLNEYVKAEVGHEKMTENEFASARVTAFLDMMQDNVIVPVEKKKHGEDLKEIAPGQVDGVELYTAMYRNLSEIAHRGPNDVPENAQRIQAKKDTMTYSTTLDFEEI